MTAKEFAKAIKRPYSTVALWLRSELIPKATFIQLGDMRVWQIPVGVVATFQPPKLGRPRKSVGGAEKPPKMRTTKGAKPRKGSK